MWEKIDEDDQWEDFPVKTSSLTPGMPTIKKAVLAGKKNWNMCKVDFELPSNVAVEDSFGFFVSFYYFFFLKNKYVKTLTCASILSNV